MEATTFCDTDDDAAPMTAETFASMSFAADAVDTVRSVLSPESVSNVQAFVPAATMSVTARPTPAISGGPRNASVPVTGSSVPIFRVSALVVPSAHVCAL